MLGGGISWGLRGIQVFKAQRKIRVRRRRDTKAATREYGSEERCPKVLGLLVVADFYDSLFMASGDQEIRE